MSASGRKLSDYRLSPGHVDHSIHNCDRQGSQKALRDGGEVFKVVANPDSGASMFIQHQSGAWLGLSTYRGEPEMQMVAPGNRRIHAIPADAPEMP